MCTGERGLASAAEAPRVTEACQGGRKAGERVLKRQRNGVTYLSVLGQIHLEHVAVVLEAEGRHREENVLAVDGFPKDEEGARVSFSICLTLPLGGCKELEVE